jgi:hypothetical protein
MRETQPFDLKHNHGCNYSIVYAKHSVILPKIVLGMKLLSHFILDTKSFILKQKQGRGREGGGITQPLDSMQTLSHLLSTLRHFISNDRTGAVATGRHGRLKARQVWND